MSESDGNVYDAIIIGAGISGLVCGCFLAKAGLKVLIAEQHFRPGGCCSSFKRKGFIFDAAAHSFGSYRVGGIMNKVFRELDLEKKVKIIKYDPTDIFITPDCKVRFWSDVNNTIREFQAAFPLEVVGIKNFISFLMNSKPIDFVFLRNKTFRDLLDLYFTDEKLKSILAFPVLGNGGLPPSLISAFTGAIIYREFLLDGGYHPEGGMQALSDALADSFEEFGGELKMSCLATKIRVKDNAVRGVLLEKDGFISSNLVISCCDARQTLFKLLGQRIIGKDVVEKFGMLIPSTSFYLVYLGIDKDRQELLQDAGTCVWILPHYEIEKMYPLLGNEGVNKSTAFMFRVSPDKKTIQIFVNAQFRNKRYWINNKKNLLEGFIKRLEDVIPGLSKHIIFKDAATPITLHRYTLNYMGAAYGWASMPTQLFDPELRKPASINGLHLCSHWTAQTQGIAGAAYLGYETAKIFSNKKDSNKISLNVT